MLIVTYSSYLTPIQPAVIICDSTKYKQAPSIFS